MSVKLRHNLIAEVLNSNEIRNKDESIYNHMNNLYLNLGSGYVSLFKLNPSQRWSLGMEQWDKLTNFNGMEDMYCSVNSLYAAGKHTSKYVKNLNALIVDLDYYNIEHLKGLSAEQVIYLLENDLNYPTPSCYIDSGRGLYIIWFLEKTLATSSSKKYWVSIEETLIKHFESFGSDSKVKDPARVLRLVGSVNSKTGRPVRVIPSHSRDEALRYELHEIASYFWGEQRDKPSAKEPVKPIVAKKKNSNIITLKTIQSLHYDRARDIEKLVLLRNGMKQEGIRELLLFIYRLQIAMCNVNEEKSLEMTLRLNSKLVDPLDESEVITRTKSAVDNADIYFRLKEKYNENLGISLQKMLNEGGVYLYKNAGIIKTLNILEEEQEQLATLINPKIKKRRKNASNKEYYQENKAYFKEKYEENKEVIKEKYKEKLKVEGKISRNEQNTILREKIKSLVEEGFKQKDIALQLGIGIATVKRHIKFICREGLK